jgi:nucleoside-diphosphate kinase
MNRTLVICKPDAVERRLVGEILCRFERRALTIGAMDQRVVDEATAAKHYEEHQGKPFYPDLISFITRGPVVAMVVEGPDDTWQIVRTMMGATNSAEAAPGTIRGDLSVLFTQTLIPGTDWAVTPVREIDIWFPGLG